MLQPGYSDRDGIGGVGSEPGWVEKRGGSENQLEAPKVGDEMERPVGLKSEAQLIHEEMVERLGREPTEEEFSLAVSSRPAVYMSDLEFHRLHTDVCPFDPDCSVCLTVLRGAAAYHGAVRDDGVNRLRTGNPEDERELELSIPRGI